MPAQGHTGDKTLPFAWEYVPENGLTPDFCDSPVTPEQHLCLTSELTEPTLHVIWTSASRGSRGPLWGAHTHLEMSWGPLSDI